MIRLSPNKNWLQQQAQIIPNKIAIHYNEIKLTYSNILSECLSTADILKEYGIVDGNHVGIFLEHGYEFFIIVNALWILGAVPVPINNRNTKNEIEFQVRKAEIEFVIADESTFKTLDNFDIGCKIIEYKFHKNNLEGNNSTLKSRNPNLDIKKTALILFTSGSSGKPKAVVHTFASLFESVKIISSYSSLSGNDSWLASLPFYHIGGFMIFVRSLIVGCTVAIPTTLKQNDVEHAIKDMHPTHVSIVSTTLKRMIENNIDPPKSIKHVYLGGGPVDVQLSLDAHEKGWKIVKVYGSTETCSMIAALEQKDIISKYLSVGKPMTGEIEITIANAKANLNKNRNQVGEILVKSKTLFEKYLNDNELTLEKKKNEYYYTGDLGWLDDEGYLYIETRRDDIIITGGENVSRIEIELLIKLIPQVQDACVFGMPDNTWGQNVCAAVVSKEITEIEIKNYLKGKIAGFKIPKQFFFTDNIPKTELGKVKMDRLFDSLNLS